MRVHHVAIQVSDLGACSAFYRDVLGLEPVEPGRPGVAWFRMGEALLMLEPVTGAVQPEAFRSHRPGLHVLAFAITPRERQEWDAKLAAANVAIDHRTAFSIYFRDPEGNRLAVSTHPDPSA